MFVRITHSASKRVFQFLSLIFDALSGFLFSFFFSLCVVLCCVLNLNPCAFSFLCSISVSKQPIANNLARKQTSDVIIIDAFTRTFSVVCLGK